MIDKQRKREDESGVIGIYAGTNEVLNDFQPCVNAQCDNFDPLDPDGNNCGILFAVSSEGCRDYFFCSTAR